VSRAKAIGPYQQQFIIDGEWLGSAARASEVINDQTQPPRSIGFVCPHCAEIWARCPVALPGGAPHPFQFITHACRKCPTPSSHGRGIYGSIVTSWNEEFTEAFPDAVWQREFLHHLSLYKE